MTVKINWRRAGIALSNASLNIAQRSLESDQTVEQKSEAAIVGIVGFLSGAFLALMMPDTVVAHPVVRFWRDSRGVVRVVRIDRRNHADV